MYCLLHLFIILVVVFRCKRYLGPFLPQTENDINHASVSYFYMVTDIFTVRRITVHESA